MQTKQLKSAQKIKVANRIDFQMYDALKNSSEVDGGADGAGGIWTVARLRLWHQLDDFFVEKSFYKHCVKSKAYRRTH